MELQINSVLEEVRGQITNSKKEVLWAISPIPALFILVYLGLYIAYGSETQQVSGLGFLHIFSLFLLTSFLFLKTVSYLHRLFIFNERPNWTALLEWKRSDTLLLKSALKIFGLYAISSLLFLKFMSPGLTSDSQNSSGQLLFGLSSIVFQLVLMIVATRILMIFPASAANTELSIKGAWKQTQIYKWKLLILLGVIPASTSILMAILPSFNNAFYQLAVLFLWIFVSVFELAILSICFKRISAIGSST